MSERVGTRIHEGQRLPADALGRDAGEDWIVARERIRYLIARTVAGGAVLSGYDAQGRLMGERFAPDFGEIRKLLDAAVAAGVAEPWREIPPDVGSALRWLDRKPA